MKKLTLLIAFQKTDETDSEDDTAYRNNTDDSVFLAKKIIRKSAKKCATLKV